MSTSHWNSSASRSSKRARCGSLGAIPFAVSAPPRPGRHDSCRRVVASRRPFAFPRPSPGRCPSPTANRRRNRWWFPPSRQSRARRWPRRQNSRRSRETRSNSTKAPGRNRLSSGRTASPAGGRTCSRAAVRRRRAPWGKDYKVPSLAQPGKTPPLEPRGAQSGPATSVSERSPRRPEETRVCKCEARANPKHITSDGKHREE